jgi:PIN domain nuclease of toxin-antitoxin system
MLTSELIKELQWSLEKYGDCEVLLQMAIFSFQIDHNVNSICLSQATTFEIKAKVDEDKYRHIYENMKDYFERQKTAAMANQWSKI